MPISPRLSTRKMLRREKVPAPGGNIRNRLRLLI